MNAKIHVVFILALIATGIGLVLASSRHWQEIRGRCFGRLRLGTANASTIAFTGDTDRASNRVDPTNPDSTPGQNRFNEPEQQTIAEPAEQVARLSTAFNSLKPEHPVGPASGPWVAGSAIHQGLVRQTQEDYAVVFQVGSTRTLLLADGCGGHAGGRTASHRAVLGAAQSVCEALAFRADDAPVDLRDVARQSLLDASRAIAVQAMCEGAPMDRAMRSTILVFLGNPDEYAYAWLGDGGAWAISLPLRVTSIIEPAVGPDAHILNSSVGPHVEGGIKSGSAEWGDAQFLVVASDGVANEINTAFFEFLLQSCCEAKGNISQAAAQSLDLLSQAPGVHDNLSIAMIARPNIARFARCLRSSDDGSPPTYGEK